MKKKHAITLYLLSESPLLSNMHSSQLQWEFEGMLSTSKAWALNDQGALSIDALYLGWSEAALLQEQGLPIISLYSTMNYLISVLYSVSHSNQPCKGLNQKIALLCWQSLEEQSTLLYSIWDVVKVRKVKYTIKTHDINDSFCSDILS